MKCNVGKGDRISRIIVGLVIIALGIIFKSWLGIIGIFPLGTALIGWCPMYAPLKKSTKKD
jgi:hypothetical protein